MYSLEMYMVKADPRKKVNTPQIRRYGFLTAGVHVTDHKPPMGCPGGVTHYRFFPATRSAMCRMLP